MKAELIDMEDLSDSREVMQKKSPPGISVFIGTMALLLIIAIIWSSFGKIDIYVKAAGEIRPAEDESTITLLNGGKIEKIVAGDGASVQKGDLLMQLDANYLKDQRQVIEDKIKEYDSDIKKGEQLITAIKEDDNAFDERSEDNFYYQYENYRLELKDTLAQISSNNKQVSSSQKEIDQMTSQAKGNLAEVSNLINEYSSLYTAIENGKAYAGSNKTIKNIYAGYASSLEKAQSAYNSAIVSYDNLVSQRKKTPDMVTQGEIDQAFYSKNAAETDIQSVKNNTLMQINDSINTLKQEQDSFKATINSNNAKKEGLTYIDNDTAKDKVKNSYYIDLNNSIDTLEREIDSLNAQLLEINNGIDEMSIVAKQDGVLVYSQKYAIGDAISSGTPIASIVPSSENYNVRIYIPEQDISEVEIGQKVKYLFRSISVTDFGKVYGEIKSISADSFTDQTTGQKFYKAIGSIENPVLTSKAGETRELKVGMIAEVNAITGQQSILSWLLDKLDFK